MYVPAKWLLVGSHEAAPPLPSSSGGRHIDAVDIRTFSRSTLIETNASFISAATAESSSTQLRDMTPMIGGVANGQKYWLVLYGPSNASSPWIPVHWVMYWRR
jgi:hypothetical protein